MIEEVKMKNKVVTNVAGQDLEVVLKSGGLYEHICLSPGQSISIPEKSLTDTVRELCKRQLLRII
tara:strand:+ start:111 stop:305 length:195 start_codon:yes stop_codon:yes gene_type:complete